MAKNVDLSNLTAKIIGDLIATGLVASSNYEDAESVVFSALHFSNVERNEHCPVDEAALVETVAAIRRRRTR